MSESMSIQEYHAATQKPRKRGNKYNAVPMRLCLDCGGAHIVEKKCESCGSKNTHRFDSTAEAYRFGELRILERKKIISDLKVQPRIPIVVNDIEVGAYVADFGYMDEKGAEVTEDLKGGTATDTPYSKFKQKCAAAMLGRPIEIVRR